MKMWKINSSETEVKAKYYFPKNDVPTGGEDFYYLEETMANERQEKEAEDFAQKYQLEYTDEFDIYSGYEEVWMGTRKTVEHFEVQPKDIVFDGDKLIGLVFRGIIVQPKLGEQRISIDVYHPEKYEERTHDYYVEIVEK